MVASSSKFHASSDVSDFAPSFRGSEAQFTMVGGSFSSSYRLVRVLRSVVQSLVPAMFDLRHDLSTSHSGS